MTQDPVNVYLDGFYCSGVAAVMGPVEGFPGDVYQLTVYVPDPAVISMNFPDLKGFQFPPLVGVALRIAGNQSQNRLTVSIGR